MDWSSFLPAVSAKYEGSRIAYYFLILVALMSTFRSLVHIIAVDGGANSIAGITVDVEGGGNIIAIFAQWGSSQLILAIITWVVVLRYRFLVPFMLSIVFLEQILRLGVGQLKALEVASIPPGGIGSLILIPATLVMLLLSLRKPEATTS